MTDFLPLFPLKMVVFPNEKLNLHVFEPRYKQLIRECQQNGVTFGVPAFIDNKIMDFGTELKLEKIEKQHEGGELDIRTKGIGIFKIREYYQNTPHKLYSGADIERVENNFERDLSLSHSIINLIEELFFTLNITNGIPENAEEILTYDLAHHVGFSIEQEYEFLCLPTEIERQNYMHAHLTRLIPVVREMERLRKRAQLNGHFKNVIPPAV